MRTYRPVVAFVRLDGNGGTVASHEVRRIVDVLEPTGTHDGVNVSADLTGQSDGKRAAQRS